MTTRGLTAVLLLVPAPTWAEVCDELAGEAWRPEHGPIDAWTVGRAAPWAAAVAGSLVLVRLTRSRGLARVLASGWGLLAVLVLAAALLGTVIPLGDQVTRAAILEGCLRADPAGWSAFLAAALALLARAHLRLAPPPVPAS